MSGNTPALTEIRDAACIILVDKSNLTARLLMGRRPKEQIFLPDKWVFPGGRVDPADAAPQAQRPISGMPGWLAPFARAGLRELAEETGVKWPGASQRAALYPIARAITPPGRVRRYDTWFFIALLNGDAPTSFNGDGELLDLAWFTADEAQRLDLSHITRLVLRDVTAALAANALPDCASFYRQGAAGFERTLIDCRDASAPP